MPLIIDSNYGPNIPKWGSTNEKANLGQCFIAIEPKFFAPDFEKRLKDLIDGLRDLEPVGFIQN